LGVRAALVPTRTVFVPPDVRREENGVAFTPSPEIEIAEAMGAATLDINSQTPGARGFALT
jgi:hypothetical protein